MKGCVTIGKFIQPEVETLEGSVINPLLLFCDQIQGTKHKRVYFTVHLGINVSSILLSNLFTGNDTNYVMFLCLLRQSVVVDIDPSIQLIY